MRTIPAVFTFRRDPHPLGCWLVYHDERGFLGRLKRKSATGAVRLLHGTKAPIAERIRAAFREGERELHFYTLGDRVFPRADYPRAGRSSVNGGPPGYCMALTAAINRMGLRVRYTGRGGERYVHRPAPQKHSGE